MKLKSFGCSFVYGSDLADCPHGVNEHNPPPSKLCFPALLARNCNLQYECHARPAAGNLQILETLLSNIDPDRDDIYLINWTWIDRFSYVSDSARSGNHPWNPLGWCSVMPSDTDQISKVYYQHLQSQFRDKLETLLLIKSGIDCLQQNGQRFLMTYSDDLIYETQWHTSPAIVSLQNYIRSHLHDFEGKSFFAWAKHKHFSVSHKGHPLEACHESASVLLTPAIDAILHRA
jgi:hypothetical protein